MPDDEADSEDEKGWRGILQEYGLFNVDEFDLALAEVVETGYVNIQKLQLAASNLNAQVIANKRGNSFEEAWSLYHDSFNDNQDQVVEMIFTRFKENVAFITPLNLNGTVSLLRELNREDLANECIEHYIEHRSSEPKLFDLDDYPFAGDITDSGVKDAFAKVTEETDPNLTLHDVVSRIAGKRGWSRKEIVVMSKASVDDFYELFKSEQGDHLRSYVNACLQFKRISNAGEQEKSISASAEKALKRIAVESDINKARVSSYGVDVDAK